MCAVVLATIAFNLEQE